MNCTAINTSACLLVLAVCGVDNAVAADPSEARGSEIKVVIETTEAETKASQPSELSVMPLDQREYPEDRPEWITSFATEHGTDYPDDKTIIIVTQLMDSPEECLDFMTVTQKAAIQEFVARSTDSLSDGDFYTISDKEIEKLVEESYQGTAIQGDMTMHERAVKLVIPSKTRKEIQTAWQNAQVQSRLQQMLGFVLTGVVMLIGSSAVVGTISRRVERRDRRARPQ